MMFRGVLLLLPILLARLRGVTSLRDVELIVSPPIVPRGGTATLTCYRDMQGSPLYSVKWYRGNHEFYRHTPMEIPSNRVFGLPGVIVDMNNSNGTQVQLRKMELSLAGNFSCEVTADAPSFSTQSATKFVDIIAIPANDPLLKADKNQYQPNEVMKANCTSSPARPAANLTIVINGEPHRSSKTSLHPSESGLYWTRTYVEVHITRDLFPSGRLRVVCVASIYNVYNESAALDFFTPDADPRPERITHTHSGASNSFKSWSLVLLLFLLPMLVMGQDLEANLEDFMEYYDESSEEARNAVLSLVGV